MNNEKLDKLRAASAGENSYLCSMGDLCQMPSLLSQSSMGPCYRELI